jgi:hypothetical protein
VGKYVETYGKVFLKKNWHFKKGMNFVTEYSFVYGRNVSEIPI